MSFQAMMRLVREGDPDGAAELVRRFEPIILRAVRKPLARFSLSRSLDPHDISQMVLARFFLQKWAFRRELKRRDQLVDLLLQMARSRLRAELRKSHVIHRLDPAQATGSVRAMLRWVLERNP